MDETTPSTGWAQLLGRRVRDAREAAGVTRLALEREADLDEDTVIRLESGGLPGISVDQLTRIARVLRVGVAELVPPVENPAGS